VVPWCRLSVTLRRDARRTQLLSYFCWTWNLFLCVPRSLIAASLRCCEFIRPASFCRRLCRQLWLCDWGCQREAKREAKVCCDCSYTIRFLAVCDKGAASPYAYPAPLCRIRCRSILPSALQLACLACDALMTYAPLLGVPCDIMPI